MRITRRSLLAGAMAAPVAACPVIPEAKTGGQIRGWKVMWALDQGADLPYRIVDNGWVTTGYESNELVLRKADD